jgi:hypothetical protein
MFKTFQEQFSSNDFASQEVRQAMIPSKSLSMPNQTIGHKSHGTMNLRRSRRAKKINDFSLINENTLLIHELSSQCSHDKLTERVWNRW